MNVPNDVLPITAGPRRAAPSAPASPQAESARRGVEILAAAWAASPDAVLIVGPDARIEYHNRRLRELWLMPADILARSDFPAAAAWMLRLLEPEAAAVLGPLLAAACPARGWSRLLRLRDGRVLDGSASPAGEAALDPCRILRFRDATAEVRAEEERSLLEAQVRRLQRSASNTLSASGLAHDFKNLLCGIIGNAELALMSGGAGTPLCEPLEAILRAGSRAEALVRRLLGTEGAGRRFMTLDGVAAEAVRLLRPCLPAHVTVALEVEPQPPEVLADPDPVHHAIVNLVTNAVHAVGRRPGTVTVSLCTERVSHAAGTPDPLPAGRYHVVRVRDDGCGIDPAVLARLFEPFFTTRARQAGNGVGLGAVRSVMRDHDGGVGVESTPGRGATFSLYFPLHDPALPAAAGGSHRGRVLLVDDEPAVLERGRVLLEFLGWRVETAACAAQACAAADADPEGFDAVLCDASLPFTAFQTLAERLRQAHPGLAVVGMGLPAQGSPGHACVPRRLTIEALGRALSPDVGIAA